MKTTEVIGKFRKCYWAALAPAIVSLGSLALAQFMGVTVFTRQASRPVTMFILVVSGVLAIALPLWLRIVFCRKQTGKMGTGLERFIRFEKMFMVSGLLATYMVPLGYLYNLPQVPLFWIIIFSLYAVYYYFPSTKRISMEFKIFRVREVE